MKTGTQFWYKSVCRRVSVWPISTKLFFVTDRIDRIRHNIFEDDIDCFETLFLVSKSVLKRKRLYFLYRTDEEIEIVRSVDVSQLRDPEPDEHRVKDPKWLICLGVCTHLGCVPLPNKGEFRMPKLTRQ